MITGERITGDMITSDRITGDRITSDRITGWLLQRCSMFKITGDMSGWLGDVDRH